MIPGAPPPEPVDRSEIQVYCPVCGAIVLVAVTDWPDGTRHASCPNDCDGGHPLTAAVQAALIRRALDLLERGADTEPAN